MRLIKLFGVFVALALSVLMVAQIRQSGMAQGCTVTLSPEQGIQTASDSISGNAVICLGEGSWQENVVIKKDDLTLRGQGADKSILKGSLLIQGARRVTVESMSVREGAFGVRLEGGELLTLRNDRIEVSSGRGVELMHVGLATLENNLIQGHNDSGVLVSLDSVARLERNQILKNHRDGVEISGSKADLRLNQLNDNLGCGVRVDATSTVTGRENEARRNAERNLCGSFPTDFLISSGVAVLDESSTPSYLVGRVSNSVEPVLQIARDRGLNARRITASEIAAGDLDAFSTLVLPDNGPPMDIVDKIVAWWSRGHHLIVIDSSITFVLYAGILFPELRGHPASESKGTYWDYSCTGTIVIQKDHPLTAGVGAGRELSAESTDALLQISKLPPAAEVLAIDKINRDQAAIVYYRGAGTLTFIGPDENVRYLKTIIGNAMALGVGQIAF